jgi:hypothetical protein
LVVFHGVYSVQSRESGIEAEMRQDINLADAAKRSRISHFVSQIALQSRV